MINFVSDVFEKLQGGRQMKRVIAVLALLAASPSAVLAADMAVKAPPPPVPVCEWCGFYIGGNAGGVWSTDSTNFGGDSVPGGTLTAIARGQVAASLSTKPSGFIGGAQAGYNVQSGNIVWGVEGDFDVSTLKRSVSLSTALPGGFFPTTTSAQERVDFIGTVRGRVGYTVTPNVLLYATGGLAYADPELSTFVNTTPGCPGFCGTATTDTWRAGWTAGVGGEWKFNRAWSLKLEYLYYDLGTLTQSYGDSAGRFPTSFVTASERFTGNIVRVGFNYALDIPPVVAKY